MLSDSQFTRHALSWRRSSRGLGSGCYRHAKPTKTHSIVTCVIPRDADALQAYNTIRDLTYLADDPNSADCSYCHLDLNELSARYEQLIHVEALPGRSVGI